jgi:hypothetical protein
MNFQAVPQLNGKLRRNRTGSFNEAKAWNKCADKLDSYTCRDSFAERRCLIEWPREPPVCALGLREALAALAHRRSWCGGQARDARTAGVMLVPEISSRSPTITGSFMLTAVRFRYDCLSKVALHRDKSFVSKLDAMESGGPVGSAFAWRGLVDASMSAVGGKLVCL